MAESIVILSAARTPLGGFQGAFAPLTAPQLGATALAAAVARAGVAPDAVDEALIGCVLPAGRRHLLQHHLLRTHLHPL